MEIKTIIIVNDFAYVNGGASEVAISSAIALSKKYRVIFFSSVGPIDKVLEKSNVEIICLGQKPIGDGKKSIALIQGIWNQRAKLKFKLLLKSLDNNSTIIHLHGWTKSLSSSFVPTMSKMKFKSVLTLHDYFTVCPNGAFYNYNKREICKLKPMSASCLASNCDKQSFYHKMWRVLRQFVQKRISGIPGKVNGFIKVSHFSYNILSQYHKFKNVQLVKNPINMSMHDPVNVAKNESYVAVGSIDFQKGPFLFAEATKMADVKSMLIGSGPLEENIKKKFSEIEITGWLARPDVIDNLNKARVLIFPSVWYETLGLVVLEAASLGIPSIVADTSAAKELIEDGVTGLLFKSNDVNDLTEKINTLKSDQIVSKLGKEAYLRYWKDPQTKETHFDELKAVYNKLASL
ncbi:glycosyltransferase family 4 protein [Ekhidna sp.]|uniref:glycosyltransferase family 4 protein n=1 Tax=Ekhidna sp. TaxID=2608089 RepID=UPI003297A38B